MQSGFGSGGEEEAFSGFSSETPCRIGDISYNMLLNELSVFDLLHVPEDCLKRFTWYASVPSSSGAFEWKHGRDALFLCHAEVAEELLDKYSGCFCVILVDDGRVPSWVTSKDRHNWVIVIGQTKRFYYYDSMLQSLFINNLAWENEMDQVVYSRGSLDKLISVSEEMLGNFVCISDTGYNLIGYSHNIEPPEGYRYLIENNCYDRDEISEIEDEVLAVVKNKNQLVICEPNQSHPYATLHYPIFIDSAYLFHIVLTCETGSLQYLQDLFMKFLRRAVSICGDFWRTTVNLESPWHRVLIGLIDGQDMTEDYLDIQLSQTAIPNSKQFRLLAFRFKNSQYYQERLRALESAKDLNNGFAYPFMHENDLLVLLYSASTNDAALSGNGVSRDVDAHMLKPFGIAAAASQIFFNIEDINFAYRQTSITYDLQRSLRNEHDSLYEKSNIPCYPFEHILKYYLLVEDRDFNLIEFSFNNSILKKLLEEDKVRGTDIVKIIWVYLNNGRNASETAKAIHMNRNTVIYHISKTEKRFDISFDSPFLRSRMLLDYQKFLKESQM